ncbi:MAG: phytanoyl-CoA dioxygenase family protein [Ahrensia sp.]|nr:phytanoyl-CoA dioxygenase family protein [Ahrensia sp.]
MITDLAMSYERDGFVSPVRLVSEQEAAQHRAQLEAVEAEHGPQHYRSKMHTLLDFAADLATRPVVLDAVETLLGPNIMLFDVTYIVKEPGSASHVSWHQDLTYWGLANDKQVTLWLALSPATEVSGCMRMVPGSHKQGRMNHEDTQDETNVLHRGQSVAGVVEEQAVMCPLRPGEASFHHGWTLHASMPNRSQDRRIGFNVQYIHPSTRQTLNNIDTATLVRGKDEYAFYEADKFAEGIMAPDAIATHAALEKLRKETWSNA